MANFMKDNLQKTRSMVREPITLSMAKPSKEYGNKVSYNLLFKLNKKIINDFNYFLIL